LGFLSERLRILFQHTTIPNNAAMEEHKRWDNIFISWDQKILSAGLDLQI